MIEQLQFVPAHYITASLKGTGGKIKQHPEDFYVEEIPLEEPSGTGNYIYFFVEKRRRLTTDVSRLLGEHFNVPMDAVSYAGLKDKHAVTRQMFCIESVDPDRAGAFEDDHIRILWVDRHDKPLKPGTLAGNRFVIRLRDVEPTHVLHARRTLEMLVERGVPNFAGEQRFGYRNRNHHLGLYYLLDQHEAFLDEMLGRPEPYEPEHVRDARLAYEVGDYDEALQLWPTVHRFERQAIGPLSRGASYQQAIEAIDRTQRSLLLSALQSSMFNHVLNQRLHRGQFQTLIKGDLAMAHEDRQVIAIEDPEQHQARMNRREISPTGPIWGPQMTRAAGQVDETELGALQLAGLEPGMLHKMEMCGGGSRKPMQIPLEDVDVSAGADEHGPYIECKFTLPRGGFATIVMREVVKPQNGDSLQ